MSQSNVAAQAIANLFAKQKWFYEKKDTILLITTGIAWLAGFYVPYAADFPVWVGIVIGGTATLAAAVTTALTKGPFTKSMVERVEREAEKIEGGTSSIQERIEQASEIFDQHRDDIEAVRHQVSGIAAHYRR